jgi:hypothetical protein
MAKKYKDRVQNARNHTYKRMMLDQSFAEHFSEQIARHLIFVPADNDSLVDSVRNEAFAKFLGIFQGTIARTKVESPLALPRLHRAPRQRGRRGAVGSQGRRGGVSGRSCCRGCVRFVQWFT